MLGEGDCDKAFLDHLRRLYVQRRANLQVKTDNAHGRGPEHIVDTAIRHTARYEYDVKVVLMDTDTPWSSDVRQEAKDNNIELIPSKPCLEGLLLRICGSASLPHTCKPCKFLIARKVNGKKLTDSDVLETLLPKALLDSARSRAPSLDRLLKLMNA